VNHAVHSAAGRTARMRILIDLHLPKPLGGRVLYRAA
jgi:hypothetical protein